MTCLDRFSQGLPDAMNVLPVRECDSCYGEIYPDDTVYLFESGDVIHVECLEDYAQKVLMFKAVRAMELS